MWPEQEERGSSCETGQQGLSSGPLYTTEPEQLLEPGVPGYVPSRLARPTYLALQIEVRAHRGKRSCSASHSESGARSGKALAYC